MKKLMVSNKRIIKVIACLLFAIAILTLGTTNTIASKLVENSNYQAGLFNNLLKEEKVIAINPGKTYYTSTNLTQEMLQAILSEQNLTISSIKDKAGETIENPERISTGDKVVLTDNSEYTVLLYGDANGDGLICNSVDVNVIREEYVNGNKADDINRLAADLAPDNILNVKDVALMVKKYMNKQDGPLVTPFPEDNTDEPKNKIKDESILKINSVDTNETTANISIDINAEGLNPENLTYEIYKITDGEEPIIQTDYTTQDFSELTHLFENLTEDTNYYVIVTLETEDTDYYAEKTIKTMVTPPTEREINAELSIEDIKTKTVDFKITLASGQTLEDGDKIYFCYNDGTNTEQIQSESLEGTIDGLKPNNEYSFWAIIRDKDDKVIWQSDEIKQKTQEEPSTPENPSRTIDAALQINELTSSSAKLEIVLAKSQKLEEGDKIIFGSNVNTASGSQEQSSSFKYEWTSLTPGREYTFWASIYDKDDNLLWQSDEIKRTVPKIEFVLIADKDSENPKTQIVANITNVNTDEFTFGKMKYVLKDVNNNLVKTEEFDELKNKIIISGEELTPGSEYILEVSIFDDAGNESKKTVSGIVLDDEDTKYTATIATDPLTITTTWMRGYVTVTPDIEEDYSVLYYIDGGNGASFYESDSLDYDYENLKSGNTYRIWAEIYSGEKRLARTNTISQYIEYPGFSLDVFLDDNNPDSSIIINAMPTSDDKFIIQNYSIVISKVNEDSTYTEVKRIDNYENSRIDDYIITELEANTTYLITVKGTDEGGNETTRSKVIKTSEGTSTPQEEQRELEGYLIITKYEGNNVTVKLNVTKGNLLNTDKIIYSSSVTGNANTRRSIESTSDTYTYSFDVPNIYELEAKVVDANGNSYNITGVEARTIIVTTNITDTTASTIEIKANINGPIKDMDTVSYRIEGPNNYKNRYELTYIDDPYTKYLFTGLNSFTDYTVWTEIKDKNGTVIAKSEKTTVRTAREELDIQINLISTNANNGFGTANVKLDVIKGNLIDGDEIQYGWVKKGEAFNGNLTTGSKEFTFENLPINTDIELLAYIIHKEGTQGQQLASTSHSYLNIRDVQITSFNTVRTGIANNLIATNVEADITGTVDTDKFIYEIKEEGTESYSVAGNGTYNSDTGKSSYTYTDLIPGKTYYLRLKVYDEDNNLLAEEELADTKGLPRIKVTAMGYESPSTTVRIKTEKDGEFSGVNFDEYDYYIYKINNDGSQTEVKRYLKVTESIKIARDLLPNTEYEVVVTARDTDINIEASAQNTVTTAEAIDTIYIKANDAEITNYNPNASIDNLIRGPITTLSLVNYISDNLDDITVSGTVEIEITNASYIEDGMDSAFEMIEQFDNEADYNIDGNVLTLTLNNFKLSNLENIPVIMLIKGNLEDESVVSVKVTADLETSPRKDITIEGQQTDILVKYRVDETPEIELNVDYPGGNKATAKIDVTNLAKIDKYYFKLYKFYNNFLIPVEASDGGWIESDSNEYVFNNLDESSRYLVVAKAVSIQGNYSEGEESVEFQTAKFRPVITVENESTATTITSEITPDETNEVNIKNYQFALIDNVHTGRDNQAIYISMPVEENTQNSFTFTGLYPNTDYLVFSQATSEHDVMSNYNNERITTEIIRDNLTIQELTTTDSITVTADTTNLEVALQEIQAAGIYPDLKLENCQINYHCNGNGINRVQYLTNASISGAFEKTFEELPAGNTYEIWMDVQDRSGKIIWTTRQETTNPTTGATTEEGTTVKLEALKIESVEANRRLENSLDIKVKLDDESIEKLTNNNEPTYTYEYYAEYIPSADEPAFSKQGTLTLGGNYQDIVKTYTIDFEDGKYYKSDNGDIFQITGLDPDKTYSITIKAIDANGGSDEANSVFASIKTRAAKPELDVEFDYRISTYESEAMDAQRLFRVVTATVTVANDAVIDWESNTSSEFNFKLYKSEIINGDATRGELVNPDNQTIRYRYTDENMPASTELETLEKKLARENAADEAKQTWTYQVSNLDENQSYLLDIKAISRLGVESDIWTKVFTASWDKPTVQIEVEQPSATKVKLTLIDDASHLSGNDALEVTEYTVNVVKAKNIVTDSSNEVISFEWATGTAKYAKTFTEAPKNLTIDDIEGLEIDNKYVAIIEAKSALGISTTYYQLIDTTAVARTYDLDDNGSKYYNTLQQAIDNSENGRLPVELIKSTTESIEINADEEDLYTHLLTAADGVSLTSKAGRYAIYNKGASVFIDDMTINGGVYVYDTDEDNVLPYRLSLGDSVNINTNQSGPALNIYSGDVIIAGKNINIINTGSNYAYGILVGIDAKLVIETEETTNENEAIKITGTPYSIYNTGFLRIFCSEGGTTPEVILNGDIQGYAIPDNYSSSNQIKVNE